MTDTPFKTLARNWDGFGRSDPFFGVLSDPAKYGGKWATEEFFASGQEHVAKLLRDLADLQVALPGGSCLDFGCGVGRLTLPLSHSFARTTGVDVAPSMIAIARREAHRGRRCEFVVNRAPHLRRFRDATFDVVHSCLVLQHMPPAVSLQYIREFLRVCRPGGIAVFQLPALAYSESELSARYALPDSAYAARIELLDPPQTIPAGATARVRVAVTNESQVTWPHDMPAWRHITIGNHWLHADGAVAVPDDGRADLPRTLEPQASCHVDLPVQAPPLAGDYLLEVDLVQEKVCWFAQKGSPTARARIAVAASERRIEPQAVAPDASPEPPSSPRSWLDRLLRRRPRATPMFEMHVVPRSDVERAICESGGTVLHAIEDGAAGFGWLSYTYVCRRS